MTVSVIRISRNDFAEMVVGRISLDLVLVVHDSSIGDSAGSKPDVILAAMLTP